MKHLQNYLYMYGIVVSIRTFTNRPIISFLFSFGQRLPLIKIRKSETVILTIYKVVYVSIILYLLYVYTLYYTWCGRITCTSEYEVIPQEEK